ncbi:MAG: DUF4258 domain-containing protein [Pyrinomonadaceae bacterium]
MNYELTQHARDVMVERQILLEWLERVLARPELIEASTIDPKLESRFGRISEVDNRVLRVVVITQVVPERIVSVYFDRRMKGKL